ncbi:hypothetical protein [Pseudorhodoplanes sp.]|uniref:hypothetical protein n=1 Tax=Pseudorhodoplanes sp. TaxID=1934341 RepID=UPI00391DA972
MNRTITTFAAAAIATAFALSPAVAQNLPPPGNVNPGSMNSGAEQTGAPNQPRSPGAGYYGLRPAYGPMTGAYYGPGYDAYAYGPADDSYAASSYAAPGTSFGPFGFAPGYGAYGYGTGGAAAIGADN